MSKDTENSLSEEKEITRAIPYYYFSFPIKFLWHDPKEEQPFNEKKRVNEVIDYSIIKYSLSGKCGNGNDEERYNDAKRQLEWLDGSYQSANANYSLLIGTVKERDIYTSIKSEYMFDALNGKFPFRLLLLLASVKSVIGKKNFTKTYKTVLLQRMYGHPNELTRYRFNKMISQAKDRGLFTMIPTRRGYFVSTKYRKTDDFKKKIEARKISYVNKQVESLEAGIYLDSLDKTLKEKLKRVNYHSNLEA
jgi:hypothetical protein